MNFRQKFVHNLLGALLVSASLAFGATGACRFVGLDCAAHDLSCDTGAAAMALAAMNRARLYVGGYVQSGTGDQVWWLRSFNPDGVEDTVHWNKQLDGGENRSDAVTEICRDPWGNIYFLGYTEHASTSWDWRIRKFDSKGMEDPNWNKRLNNLGLSDGVNGAVVDGQGNLYVAGYTQITTTPQHYKWWIRKFYPTGVEDLRWNKVLESAAGLGDIPAGIAVDAFGDVYVYGAQETSTNNTDWRIRKFTADGIEITTGWNKTFAGAANGVDEPAALAFDSRGNIYVVGTQTGATNGNDWWLKKFSLDGTEDTTNWNKTFDGGTGGSDRALGVAVGPNDEVYVVGRRTQTGTLSDLWIKKFDANGVEDTTNWNKTFDGGFSQDDEANAVVVDPAGNVYVAATLKRSASDRDWWLKKFSAEGTEDPTWNFINDGGYGLDDAPRALLYVHGF